MGHEGVEPSHQKVRRFEVRASAVPPAARHIMLGLMIVPLPPQVGQVTHSLSSFWTIFSPLQVGHLVRRETHLDM